jgi:DNA-binding winged helix-turn-helix (wHTH) protein
VLAALLEHAGQIVSREELRHRLWSGNIFVDFENNLNAIVAHLRQVLCDAAERPRFIETVPRRGYRFIAAVHSNPNLAVRAREVSPDAYNEYIEARYLSDRGSRAAFSAAKLHLEKAIEADLRYADAYDLMAEIYWYLGYFGFMAPRRAFSAGIVHALRAIELDPARAETHALLGQFHKIAEYNWDEVQREMRIAFNLNPKSALVRTRYAVSYLMPHARLDEAIAELEGALESDPLLVKARSWLGIMLTLARRHSEAIECSRRLLDIEANSWPAHFVLALCNWYAGNRGEAVAHQYEAVQLSGNAPGMLGWLGMILSTTGDTAAARGVLDRLQSTAAVEYVPPSCFAWIHVGLKQIDEAFDWMDRAVDECDQFMMPIRSYIFLEPLRGDPRYGRLLRRMNLV